MTRMEIDISAGPDNAELDVWLARHLGLPPLSYTSQIDAAWSLLDHIRTFGLFYQLGMHHITITADSHVCELWSIDRARYEAKARADTAPRAISLAVYNWAKGKRL